MNWSPPEPAKILEMWREADQYLVKERRDYWLNGSYYLGHQWIWWDMTRNLVQEIDYASDAERNSRITVDKFGPRVQNLLARMIRAELTFEVQPQGTDDSSMRRQKLQEQLLIAEQHQRDWELTREMAVLQTLFGGASAVCVEWDPEMGEDSYTDMETGIAIPDGGIRLTPMGINEFTLEPGTQDPADARWYIRATSLPPAQVQERYNLDWLPEPDAEAMMSSRARSMLLRRPGSQPSRTTMVYVYFERPTRTTPGCIVHVVNGKVVLQEDSWPFPFPHLNLVLFRQKKIPNTWVGHTLCTPARDIQYAYNRARSTIMEHMRKAANSRFMVPSGSVDDADVLTTDPGDTLEYNAELGEPHWQTAPDVPRWISAEAAELEMELDDIFHTHAASRGQAPGDRNSGLALSLLAEKDDTPLGPMARDQAKGWGLVGQMTLMLYRMNAEATGANREATILTEHGQPLNISWGADDIDEKPKVVVPLDSTSPRSKLATQSVITALADRFPQAFQNIDPLALARMLDLPDPRGYLTQVDPDAAKAQWENGLLMQAVPVVPEDFDLHDVHINIHNKERKSPAYELADPSVKQIIDLHVMAHQRMMMGDTQAALDAQALMNEGQQPTAAQAMTVAGGITGNTAQALQPGANMQQLSPGMPNPVMPEQAGAQPAAPAPASPSNTGGMP
jgi:hypothetical protein